MTIYILATIWKGEGRGGVDGCNGGASEGEAGVGGEMVQIILLIGFE